LQRLQHHSGGANATAALLVVNDRCQGDIAVGKTGNFNAILSGGVAVLEGKPDAGLFAAELEYPHTAVFDGRNNALYVVFVEHCLGSRGVYCVYEALWRNTALRAGFCRSGR